MKNKLFFLLAISSFSFIFTPVKAYVYSLNQAQKEKITDKVKNLIYKDRATLILEGGTLFAGVVALQSEILPRILPDFFIKTLPMNVQVTNPDGKLGLRILNLFISCGQGILVSKCLNLLHEKGLGMMQRGTWNFTLKIFLKKHSHVYSLFEMIELEMSNLLYQDKQIRNALIMSLESKINLLAQQISYIDGYALYKINQYDQEAKFNAKSNALREYKIFEEIRNDFITNLFTTLQLLKDSKENEDFQNTVFASKQALQYGSQNINQRINTLELYL